VRLLDYLDGAVWALYLAGSAGEALIRVFDGGFLLYDLEDFYGADVDAGSASITLVFVYFNFNHELVRPPRDDLDFKGVSYER